MIYFTVNQNNEVNFIHYKPFDVKDGLGKTEEELLKEGYLVDTIPEPEHIEGKISQLKMNEEGELYYEYVDRPLTPEEQAEQRIAALEESMLALMFSADTTAETSAGGVDASEVKPAAEEQDTI